MLNLKAYILFFAAIQGLLLSLALFTKKAKNQTANIGLAFLILVFSLELLFSWGSAARYNNLPHAFPFWKLISYLVIPPALWLFFQGNVDGQVKSLSKIKYWFTPAILEILIELFLPVTLPDLYTKLFRNEVFKALWFFSVEILPLLASLTVMFWVGKSLWKKKTNLSNPEMWKHFKRVAAVYIFVSIFLILWTLLVIFNVQIFRVIEILLVGCVFLLGYLSYFRPDYFEVSLLVKTNAKVTKFSNYDDENEVQRLKQLFENQKIYTQSKLSITEVAQALDVPTKYLSYLISSHLHTNFNDFVNTYRVKEVIKRIKDPAEKHKSILGIALDAGFGSKSSFNQVFKAQTGKTPSEYLSS